MKIVEFLKRKQRKVGAYEKSYYSCDYTCVSVWSLYDTRHDRTGVF